MSITDDACRAIAAAIGEPARARMLYCLMDGRARTSTELAVVAEVSPSTASVHLQRLKDRAPGDRLRPGQASLLQPRTARRRGRARSVERPGRAAADAVRAEHARAACAPRAPVTTTWPARSAVALHDRFDALGWLSARLAGGDVLRSDRRMARRRWRRWASMSTRRGRCAAASRSPAWTGASAGRISAARSARRCLSSR